MHNSVNGKLETDPQESTGFVIEELSLGKKSERRGYGFRCHIQDKLFSVMILDEPKSSISGNNRRYALQERNGTEIERELRDEYPRSALPNARHSKPDMDRRSSKSDSAIHIHVTLHNGNNAGARARFKLIRTPGEAPSIKLAQTAMEAEFPLPASEIETVQKILDEKVLNQFIEHWEQLHPNHASVQVRPKEEQDFEDRTNGHNHNGNDRGGHTKHQRQDFVRRRLGQERGGH